MPLTFAHPAIVLPLLYLQKRRASLTGLIIGSITPDFEYFIRMRVYSIYSHTWAGLLWFDVPLAILLAFIYHGVVRNKLLANMPTFLKQRFSVFANFNWPDYFKSNVAVVLLSILVGAASHLFWDSFTHANGYFVIAFNIVRPVSMFGITLRFSKLFSILVPWLVVLSSL